MSDIGNSELVEVDYDDLPDEGEALPMSSAPVTPAVSAAELFMNSPGVNRGAKKLGGAAIGASLAL